MKDPYFFIWKAKKIQNAITHLKEILSPLWRKLKQLSYKAIKATADAARVLVFTVEEKQKSSLPIDGPHCSSSPFTYPISSPTPLTQTKIQLYMYFQSIVLLLSKTLQLISQRIHLVGRQLESKSFLEVQFLGKPLIEQRSCLSQGFRSMKCTQSLEKHKSKLMEYMKIYNHEFECVNKL